MTTARVSPLAGLRVVVTRPRAQAVALVAALEADGADVIRMPAIDIEPRTPPANALDGAGTEGTGIAVSVNAVRLGVPWLREHAPACLAWHWLAVGPTTALALRAEGISASVPTRHNVEGLLSVPELRNLAQGACALLMRGEGGRRVLPEALRSQGVTVFELPVYRRVLPTIDTVLVDALVHSTSTTVVLISSVDAFDNLCELFAERSAWLLSQAVLAPVSERIERHIMRVASPFGVDGLEERFWRLPGATTGAILAGLRQNYASRNISTRT